MRFIIFSLSIFAFIISCQKNEFSIEKALQIIDKNKILKDTQVLSSDNMQGRAPGTEGEQKAANYIAKRFQESGLIPLNGSLFQTFEMLGIKKDADKSSLRITYNNVELPYASNETLTYWSTNPDENIELKNAEIIFVGYGVQAPEFDWDDFKGTDVKGKVLLFLNNDPPVSENGVELFSGETRTYYGRWTYKFEQAMRLGASGAIMIHTTPSASYPFRVIQNNGEEENFLLDLPNSGYQVDFLSWIDKQTAETIAGKMGTNLNGLFEMGASRDFKPVATGYKLDAKIKNIIRKTETKNVLGILPGSDPQLKKQVIVFSAHYDHLGVNENLNGEDKIYNGAWDNALGTSAIINLAEAFSALSEKPKRSILFLACAAEESGSLGSKWFVASPPFERNQIAANFNIDMPQIFGLTSDIAAIGVEMNSLGEALKEVASGYEVTNKQGEKVALQIKGDTDPNAGKFYRSDQVNFAKAGIPALYINPGKDFVKDLSFEPSEYKNNHYHQVIDQINDSWDLSGCERDMRVLFETALIVANKQEIPRWVIGNEFEGKWKNLHGIE